MNVPPLALIIGSLLIVAQLAIIFLALKAMSGLTRTIIMFTAIVLFWIGWIVAGNSVAFAKEFTASITPKLLFGMLLSFFFFFRGQARIGGEAYAKTMKIILGSVGVILFSWGLYELIMLLSMHTPIY